MEKWESEITLSSYLPSPVPAKSQIRSLRKVKGAISIPHPHGCAQLPFDAEQTSRTLIGVGKNPNVAAILVIGLGCEVVEAPSIALKIARVWKTCEESQLFRRWEVRSKR